MITYLCKISKWVALLLLTILYCQTVLSAYEPWRNRKDNNSGFAVLYTKAQLSDNKGQQIIASPEGLKITDPVHKNFTSVKSEIKNIKHQPEGKHIGGPTQPEMTSFKSVNDNNMVDLFSGNFSYNIPLLDVGGYPVNLFYQSGVTMDQEASWVGLGWNINPGTITRNLRGIPDDFDGKNDIVQKTTSIAVNKTIGGDVGGDLELVGLPILHPSLGLNVGVFYNNYRGWGIENGLDASIKAGVSSMGTLSAGLSIVNNSQQGLTVSPSLNVTLGHRLTDDNTTLNAGLSIGGGFSYNSRSGLVSNLSTGLNLSRVQGEGNNTKTSYQTQLYSSCISFASPSYTPSSNVPMTNHQFTFTAKVGLEFIVSHPNIYLKGYVSKQFIAPEDLSRTYPAYGYLYYQDANDNPQALLDFNREKDIIYRESPPVPNIAVPSYTYDIFNIAGEGSGGMFRVYRGDIGYVHDPYVSSKDQSDAASVDVGVGDAFHGGIDVNINHAITTTSSWTDDNPLANTLKFKQSDSVYEAAYMRNPGEKSINAKSYYNNIGDDDVVTAQLYQAGNGPVITSTNSLQHWKNKTATNATTFLNSSNDFKSKRDKRTQVISYLNAAEASRVGLDTMIYNYGLNQWGSAQCSRIIQEDNLLGYKAKLTVQNNVRQEKASKETVVMKDVDKEDINQDFVIQEEARVNSFRQPNHISEINVLNADGRRYCYGLPVYNLIQKEVTFAADSIQNDKVSGMVKYTDGDAGVNNHHGVDNYFQQEITGAYAHSFLLTGILSPDYVDVTGNGISDDDLGDAIKFNYTKVAGQNNPFGWKTPYNTDSATYNEGLQTYVRDDKGSYIYGEKELWYMNSIESKNMVAVFILGNRSDLGSITERSSSIDTTIAKRLEEIDLYSKSDYIQNGAKAKPIKTVHFAYTYDLCKGLNHDTSQGKLTLKKVWFTYNGNKKGIKNPYLFFYNTSNPNYANGVNDRWGNYKSPLQNPRSSESDIITNAEYPYALQDSNAANLNAAAWTMDSLILPSSGSIKVGYESDDYAYVQNKRAMQMFNVIGLSASQPYSLSDVSKALYDPSSGTDNLYVAIRVNSPVFSAKDVYQKYLDGFQKIYFKLKVQMPTDQWGSGCEYIPVYADLNTNSEADSTTYGVLANDIIWISLKGISLDGTTDGNYSPLVKAATQFLRLNLPSKAYPGSEVGDKLDLKVAAQLIGALGSNIINGFSSFDNTARTNGWCVNIDTSKTLIRLDNPVYKKYGGGLRVKFIKIYDNWKNMTNPAQQTIEGRIDNSETLKSGNPDQKSSLVSQSVYGQVYDYTTIKNINGVDTRISSGVASWEPMMGHEENPFIIPLEYIQKVAPLAPVTMGYTELPLGETFFPAPSVGYSQVRVSSIHSANIKSATGYEETKFYTSYDFPTITDNSLFTPDTKKRYKTSLSDFLRIRSYHYLTMSQGFKIELNDMNGKIKSQASYSQTDSIHPIGSSTYYYHVDDQNAEFKHLNNTVKTVDKTGAIDTTTTIGKDIELMTDMREQHSLTEGVDYGLNVDVFVLFIIPIAIPSDIPMPQKEETRFRSVAITKVINRFGILDSVVVIDKGSKVSTDNLLYDSETGEALLTRTKNEFNDTIYNFTYPAHWAYSGMGPAYQNINAEYNYDQSDDIKILNGVLQPNSKYPGMLSRFESGDEILAIGKPKTGQDTNVNCAGITGCPTPIFSTDFNSTKIWAINSKKIDSTNALGIVFIDRDGNPYSGDNLSLKIIRSGHRNLSSTPVGSLTMLKTPIRIVNNKLQLQLDSNKNVLASSAVNYNDVWKVADVKKSLHVNSGCACGPLKALFDYLIYSRRLFIQQSDNVSIASLVQDAQNSGYNVDINDCPLLSNNKNELFYALTNDSIGSSYSAQIGYNTISITSNTADPIHFYYLQSQPCNQTGTVTYTSLYNPMEEYLVYNTSDNNVEYSYLDCAGNPANNAHVLNAHSDEYVCAQKGMFFLPSNGSIDTSSVTACADTCTSLAEITLSVDLCQNCMSGICIDPITDTLVNPYVYGIYGNWRSQKSYVYYGNRRESLTSNTTNIRSNGIIQNFFPYWGFGASYLKPTTDTNTYVWNAASTLYNRKGFEIENKDPLGRYNAGSYGYNESLPIDVVQNSKYKDQFFDGFEDYSYATQLCQQNCKVPRNINFFNGVGIIDSSVTHSGKFSLQIHGLDSSVINSLVTPVNYNDSQKINEIVNITSFIDTIVSPKGNGNLKINYYEGNVNFIDNYTGYIQANASGYYTISVNIGYVFQHGTNGYQFTVGSRYVGPVQANQIAELSVYLLAGEKTLIKLDAFEDSYFSSTPTFHWQRLGDCGDVTAIPVPSVNLYSPDDTSQSVNYDSTVCATDLKIKTDSGSLLPNFKPAQGNKMVFSAWVKEQRTCLCQQYDSNRVNFIFTRSQHPDTVLSFRPGGNIIEGWQRYDTIITVPADATSMRLALKSIGNSPVNFDDVRMYPYNANMKSFVYDPVSLRLMAELDENNYATFYEYDDDGTLIRVKKETDRGIQTIKETRSSLSQLNNQ